jgi:CheY-like chemotaxis protein
MPKMNGVDAVRIIRAQGKCKSDQTKQPVIFGITANALAEDVDEFEAAGCDKVSVGFILF